MAVNNTYLKPPKAPVLPVAPVEYGQRYGDELASALRLYFNQLDNTHTVLFGANGGRYIERPYALYYDTTSQTLALANTAYAVTYSNTYFNNGISLVDNSKIYVAQPGVYAFTISVQLKSSNASSKDVWLWINRTNIDIGYSTRAVTLSRNDEYTQLTWDFIIDVPTADDYIQMRWGASSTNVRIDGETGTAPHPGIPSVVMYVTYVSPLPTILPTPP